MRQRAKRASHSIPAQAGIQKTGRWPVFFCLGQLPLQLLLPLLQLRAHRVEVEP